MEEKTAVIRGFLGEYILAANYMASYSGPLQERLVAW